MPRARPTQHDTVRHRFHFSLYLRVLFSSSSFLPTLSRTVPFEIHVPFIYLAQLLRRIKGTDESRAIVNLFRNDAVLWRSADNLRPFLPFSHLSSMNEQWSLLERNFAFTFLFFFPEYMESSSYRKLSMGPLSSSLHKDLDKEVFALSQSSGTYIPSCSSTT